MRWSEVSLEMQVDAAPAMEVTQLQAFPAGTPAPHIPPLLPVGPRSTAAAPARDLPLF